MGKTPSRDIRELGPGDFVRVGQKLLKIKSVYGVNWDGTLVPVSKGGYGCITETDEDVSMWRATGYFKKEDLDDKGNLIGG